MYFRVRLFIMLGVGKLVFPRDRQGRNQGRLMNRRKDIEKIDGLLLLDFKTKDDGTEFRARVTGTTEAVQKALEILLLLADTCGFSPGSNITIYYSHCL